MKKSLVLAMAMALGVTASAYAANPFSDVPAGHWAYDAVNKLAAEGVVDGYPDGTYGGDKLMTRYEMAQIVAKAMAKGANVDKLAAEFADELDSLGVRVANLEKKADNVKITGQIRASYRDVDGDSKSYEGRLRTRLFVNGAINEDWTYTGRFENSQYYTDESGDDEVKLNWAYVSGRVGGAKVTAGRQDFKLHSGNVIDATVDGAIVSYGDKVKLTGYVGKAVDSGTWDNLGDVTLKDAKGNAYTAMQDGDRVYIADLSAKLGVVDAFATYYKADTFNDNEIWNVGAGLEVVKDLKLSAEYLHGDAQFEGDNNGYVVGLAYRGAKAAKPGSWGVYANYYDQPASTYLEHTIDGYATFDFDTFSYDGTKPVGQQISFNETDGFKGYEVGANVALAKNIVAAVKYYDLEAREGNYDEQTIWSEVVFTF